MANEARPVGLRCRRCAAGCAGQGVAAVLDDDHLAPEPPDVREGLDQDGGLGGRVDLQGGPGHGYSPTEGRPAVSGSPRARLAHWMAWPAAPLVRLSMAAMATIQPVRSS